MTIKRFAFTAAALCCLIPASAYKGVAVFPDEELLAKTRTTTYSKVVNPATQAPLRLWLEGLYMPEYQIPRSASEPGNTTGGKTYGTDYTTTTSKNITKNFIDNANINGWPMSIIDEDKVVRQELMLCDGMCLAKVPAQGYMYGELEDIPQGDLRIRIAFGAAGNRPGDIESGLSLIGCTGIAVSLVAPAGTEVYCTFVAANGSQDFGDGSGQYVHNTIYKMPAMTGNVDFVTVSTPEEGTDILLRWTDEGRWVNGFACKYFDIIFKNVKTGDIVGFGDYQTLEPDYTPTHSTHDISSAYSGIESIEADMDAPVEYFTLQGMRVENPTCGLYIKRHGTTATKVWIK